MRLAHFIRTDVEEILKEAVTYARHIPVLSVATEKVLRNHLPLVLEAIALDLEQPQTSEQSIAKSLGAGPRPTNETAAQTHGTLRARSGLHIEELVAEYRVIRSTVLRLWAQAVSPDKFVVADTLRFNEAIDQAIAESVAFHSAEVEKWRNIFLGVLGHDLRGPLNAILLTSELLESSGTAPRAAGSLLRSSRRLGALLDSLLEYNKISLGVGMQLHRQPTDIAVECFNEVDIIEKAFPHRKVVFEKAGETAGNFDKSRVRQALTNLVSNAAQHSPDASLIEVSVLGTQNDVQITTKNQADPIDQEVLDTLFDPLRRNASDMAGSSGHLGLGLFIVREISRAHGGDVRAKTADGSITFTITLPKSFTG